MLTQNKQFVNTLANALLKLIKPTVASRSTAVKVTPPRGHERWSDREMLILREMSKLLGRSLDARYTIGEALHLLSELVGLNRGRVLLPEPRNDAIVIRYAYCRSA